MHTTRRKALCFLAGASVAPALAIPAIVTAQAEPETQEEKVARLLSELMAECRKLPLTMHTRFGRAADIQVGQTGDYARYGYNEERGASLTVLLEATE